MKQTRAAILYKGPSMLDGRPIVVIGIYTKGNRKTGKVLQTYILCDGIDPREAIRLGYDGSICGDCIHRGDLASGKGRTCYVNIGQGVLRTYDAYTRGIYPTAHDIAELGRGRKVRLGTYGDPAAVPFYIWQQLLSAALSNLGYTHQWRRAPHLRGICMASVDSVAEELEAVAAGWRCFRVAKGMDPERLKGEAVCPASAEAGKKLTCDACGACNGTGTGRRGSVVIQAHGGTATMANVRRRFPVAVVAVAA